MLITSVFFNGRLKLIPMLGEETTYDYDGTDMEFRILNKMLNSTQGIIIITPVRAELNPCPPSFWRAYPPPAD
jgi:hypothetical protein